MPQDTTQDKEETAPRKRSLRRGLAMMGLVFRESFASFLKNQQLDNAAMLAYYGFLSLIPLLLLLVVLFSGYVLSSRSALDALQSISHQIFPDFSDAALLELRKVSQQRIWSLLSVVVLFWAITPLAAAIRGTFDRVFTPERAFGYLHGKVRDIAGALTLLGLFVLVVIGKIVYGALQTRLQIDFSAQTTAINGAATFLFSLGGLCFFYWVFAPGRLRFVEILGGALVAMPLLFLLRPAFAWFLRFNPNYGFAFGSLKAIFLLLTWVYFSFVIILYGAEIIAGARRRDLVLLRDFLHGPDLASARASHVLVQKFVRECKPGETIFREGEPGHEMFYIRAGAVELRRADRAVRVMRKGEYFGEMSMLIDTPRTAAAIAAEPGTELVEISRDNFESILRENPQIAQAILKEMALRLKMTDEELHRQAANET